MILNDMKKKIKGQFSKEISLDDNGEDITYIFPDTSEFISILRRKLNKTLLLD
ncbi:unnamed protein product [marine sediment metagenome]|jgi:hypothetical protein|uniref:Uncharacterized protein n=1 Tax=marine sediment metagenome TaxID=412755 RepID=X1T5M5_9ZZZZ